jgi:iron complex transport system substrate-binding protein
MSDRLRAATGEARRGGDGGYSGPALRICSLVPAATEVLFALGLGDSVVGVSHECDFPAEAASRPVVTASLVETGMLASAAVDDAVRASAENGRPLYAIDAERWAEVAPDVVITQELCAVCAVSSDDVGAVVEASGLDVDTVPYSPGTLDGIVDGIAALGERFGAEGEADELTSGMRSRLERVSVALAHVETAPRVFVAEWLEPPYSAGHWVPDMVANAGGIDVAGLSGERSYRLQWSDVARLRPDVVVVAPCGFDLDRTLGEIAPLELAGHLLGTPAREESRVFAVDADACFSRPGPRVVDGVELLAYLLHPEAYRDPGFPWSRVRV